MEIQYNSKDKLGEGGFGSVFLGRFNGHQVAVKRVELRYVSDIEEQVLKQLNHPNVIKLFHSESDKHFKYFALELCVASLDQLFLKSGDPRKYKGPKLPHNLTVFLQLALGLEYIHSRYFIHRNIKPKIVLISIDSAGLVTIKWASFGLSQAVDEQGTFTQSGIKGSLNWFAPELLKKIESEKEEFGRGTVKSDVFALALVYGYLLLDGQHLYGSRIQIPNNILKKEPVNLEKIKHLHYARNLLSKMLADEPSKRISSSQVVIELKSIENESSKKERELCQLCQQVSLDLREIEFLIQFGIDVNGKDDDGWNALHHLCRNNSSEKLIDAMKLLIQYGIDVNEKSNAGSNALHLLCKNKASEELIDAIQLLIQHGIDLNGEDNDGQNALHYLRRYNSNVKLFDEIQLLVQFRKIQIDDQVPLGKGGFGVVFLGKFDGRQVAVKRVELRNVSDIEEKVLKQLNHPNVIKLFHSEKDDNFKYFALELCHASLDKLFLKSGDPQKYNGPELPPHLVVFLQLALGLEYIHSKKLIHRDIRPENVLISVDSAGLVTIKWADFGLSRSVNHRGTCTLSGIKGTLNWLAPELLKSLANENGEDEFGRGNVKSDVFALALVYGYLLLDGQHLYGSRIQIPNNILSQAPINMEKIDRSHYARDLLPKMLTDEPDQRISSLQVVNELKSIKF